VQMYGNSFEEVVSDFVEICGDGSDSTDGYVSSSPEVFEVSPYMYVVSFLRHRLYILGTCIGIYPLLDVDGSGTVIDLEGSVCCLGLNFEDLADERKLFCVMKNNERRSIRVLLKLHQRHQFWDLH